MNENSAKMGKNLKSMSDQSDLDKLELELIQVGLVLCCSITMEHCFYEYMTSFWLSPYHITDTWKYTLFTNVIKYPVFNW